VPSNNDLKNLRKKRNLTIRDVEQASRRIAEAKGDNNYCISNSWLTQLEHGVSMPNPCTIFSLCATYCVSFADILQLYGVNIHETEKYQHVANPQLTQMMPEISGGDYPRLMLVDKLLTSGTALITELSTPPAMDANREIRSYIRYGYIGLSDDTMYPLIRPGAVVEIDTRQCKIPPTVEATNEFEKPIFFVELRDGWAFGWCELQGKKLVITPYPLSRARLRQFDYPREAEIFGRVVGYNTPCIDGANKTSK
jgi:transcriptional regulator with XRE-family HTH domain